MTFSNLEFFQVLSTGWQVSNWLETLHSYYRHIEDVRLLFWMINGGGIGEEGNMRDGQAQHGSIICVLQTEKNKFCSEWRFSERKEQFKETKTDSFSLSPFMYSNIMLQQSKWEKAGWE